jgi:Fe-S cluster biogenesis protein NfuA
MFIETETTPNPATLKFLPGQRVMPSGTRDFASPEEAEASPLAQALFDTGEVTGVLLGADFVAVTAGPGADWGTLKPQVVAVLLDHFISQTPLFASEGNGIAVPSEANEGELLYPDDPAQADVVEQIKELIETRVRPAVANDGGDIRYRGFHDGVVYLQMQGACSGCPSSTATLKQGIEGLLKHYVPEVTEVRAA